MKIKPKDKKALIEAAMGKRPCDLIINNARIVNVITEEIYSNFGTNAGAVGSTISHDSHNMTIVYDKPENAYIAAKDLMNTEGGLSCV